MTNKLTRVLAVGASTAALLWGMLLTAPVAFASAQGCTGTNLRTEPAMLCTSVEGESTKVDSIQASIDIKTYTWNADFKVWGTYANGKPYSDTGHAKCGVGRVWVD